MLPEARHDRLLVEEVGDEVVLYDEQRHHAHRLNRAAGLVWRHCDGNTTVGEMTAIMARELSVPADERVVQMALDGLDRAHLLREHTQRAPRTKTVSRRDMVKALGLAGAAALFLPAVTSVTAPTPLMAQSALGISNATCMMRNASNCGGTACSGGSNLHCTKDTMGICMCI